MADSKISDLTDGSPLVSTDLFVVARGGGDNKIPASSLKQFLASDKKTRTSGDITTTSTTFVVLDTGLNITLTTGARRCLVVWTVNGKNSGTSNTRIDVEIDGTRVGQTYGLVFAATASASFPNVNLSGSFITDALSAASHTFKLMGSVDGGTGTFYASTGVSPIFFSVVELAI